jgi:DNA-directed RNA polymerase specialized sigma24 family protein
MVLVREGQRIRVPGWSKDGILGSDEYRKRMKFLWDRQRDDPDAPVSQRFAERPSLESMLGQLPAGSARDLAMLAAHDGMRYSQAEIARYTGLSRGAVSRTIARARSVQVKT